jgi:hypothetical protein
LKKDLLSKCNRKILFIELNAVLKRLVLGASAVIFFGKFSNFRARRTEEMKQDLNVTNLMMRLQKGAFGVIN